VIVRLVIGVVLTASLVAVAAPAMSTASADAADSSVERQVTALSERLERVVATNDPTRGPGARHVTTLRLPARSVTSTGVEWLRFESRGGVGLASWQVSEGQAGTARISGVPLRAPDGNLTLREPGPHRIVFSLRAGDDGPVLTVSRLGGGR